MSTNDVPGKNKQNGDVLAMGGWGEHEDGSLIFVESVEGGRVVYSIFDLAPEPPVEYRDAMPEDVFKDRFSWPTKDGLRWTWHDKTPFPWDRVMRDFASGRKDADVQDTLSAAARVAQSLQLRAEGIRDREVARPTGTPRARAIADRIAAALDVLLAD